MAIGLVPADTASGGPRASWDVSITIKIAFMPIDTTAIECGESYEIISK